MRMSLTGPLVAALAAGLAGCVLSSTPTDNQSVVTAYRTAFTKLTTKPYSAQFGLSEIYANDVAKPGIEAGTNPMPVGSILVQEVVPSGVSGGTVTTYYVMEKMPAGFDPDNGDWYYAIRDGGTNEIANQGRIAGCISCHVNARTRDYVFAVPDSVKAY